MGSRGGTVVGGAVGITAAAGAAVAADVDAGLGEVFSPAPSPQLATSSTPDADIKSQTIPFRTAVIIVVRQNRGEMLQISGRRDGYRLHSRSKPATGLGRPLYCSRWVVRGVVRVGRENEPYFSLNRS